MRFNPLIHGHPAGDAFSLGLLEAADVPINVTWEEPASLEELLGRIHPKGAPDLWIRFFAGEEVDREDQKKILAGIRSLKGISGHVSQARHEHEEMRRNLLRFRKELEAYKWIESPREVISKNPRELSAALGEKAACELKISTVQNLLDRTGAIVIAHERDEKNLQLLETVAEAIINKPAELPDRYRALLPAPVIQTIDDKRARLALQARAEMERRLRLAEEEARKVEDEKNRARERLAAVENQTLEELLDIVFTAGSSTIPAAFLDRTLTMAQYQVLADIKETPDPIKRRACERLIAIGADIIREIALKPPPPPPSEEELEAARQAKLREEEEARRREIEAKLAEMEAWHYPSLCHEVIQQNMCPLEWADVLARATDYHRQAAFREYFSKRTKEETDPVRKRLCELMVRRIGSNNPVIDTRFTRF